MAAFSLLMAGGTVASAGLLLYGSVRALPAMAQGQAVLVEPPVFRSAGLEAGRSDRIAFGLLNLTSRPVRVVGIGSSCTCLRAVDLPIDLPPHSRQRLDVEVRPTKNQEGPSFSQTVELFLSTPSSPVTISVSGPVAEQKISP